MTCGAATRRHSLGEPIGLGAKLRPSRNTPYESNMKQKTCFFDQLYRVCALFGLATLVCVVSKGNQMERHFFFEGGVPKKI